MPASASVAGRWIVLAPPAGSEVASWVARALQDRGADVVPVPAGAATDRDDLARQLTEVVAAGPVAGVLSLLGMDEEPAAGREAVTAGLVGTLLVVQAQADAGVDAPLWCLTQGAVGTEPSQPPVRPAQAQVWGLGRVVGLEAPGRWGGLVDLPATLDDGVAEALCESLAAGGDEEELAIRPGGVFVRRLTRATSAAPSPIPDHATSAAPSPIPDRAGGGVLWGTALVTGGTGALGGHVARWLVARGADHVVLASRGGQRAPGAAELVAELEAQGGARVTVASCDVSDRGAVAALLRDLPPDQPLRLVVHAAGTDVRGDLAGLAVDDLVEAAQAKVLGARHLHELTRDHDLDGFVLFSSGAAVWGGAGQAAYAAANAFLDALAEQRRAEGLPATAVAWGPWAGGGMAGGPAAERLRRSGVRQMEPGLAIAALQDVLARGDTCVAVADLDWERFAPSYAAARRRPLIQGVPEAVAALEATGPAAPAAGPSLAQRLADASPAARPDLILGTVRAAVATVLGHAGAEDVEPDRPFKDLGFDSVTAVELRNHLSTASGLPLPATLVFDHSTPQALAGELARQLLPAPRPAIDEALDHLAAVDAALPAIRAGAGDVTALRTAAHRLLAQLAVTAPDGAAGDGGVEDRLRTAGDDELLAFIDRELGAAPPPGTGGAGDEASPERPGGE